MATTIHTRRVYESKSEEDGFRVLIDRLWPRGVTKEAAAVDIWAKEIAPSTDLRNWFDHDPAKFEEFSARYRAELASHDDTIRDLLRHAGDGPLTLVFAASDEQHNHAIVLAAYLREIA